MIFVERNTTSAFIWDIFVNTFYDGSWIINESFLSCKYSRKNICWKSYWNEKSVFGLSCGYEFYQSVIFNIMLRPFKKYLSFFNETCAVLHNKTWHNIIFKFIFSYSLNKRNSLEVVDTVYTLSRAITIQPTVLYNKTDYIDQYFRQECTLIIDVL